MSQKQHVMHGRDHLPHGADPIPGLCTGCETPIPPSEGIPVLGPIHWWRMQTLDTSEPTPPQKQPIYTPDEVTGEATHRMVFTWQDEVMVYHADVRTAEVSGGHDGPSSDSMAIRRDGPVGVIDVDEIHESHEPRNGDNWWAGAAPNDMGAWGDGSEWTMAGWFTFEGYGDVFNLDPTGTTPGTCLAANVDGSVTLYRAGTTFTSATGLVPSSGWTFLAVTLGADQLKVYVNPGTATEPAIDAADPETVVYNAVFSIGGNNDYPLTLSGGSFAGYATEIVLFDYPLTAAQLHDLYIGGKYGVDGSVPPNENIPAGGLLPSQIAPGEDGQHLVTAVGVAQWADDTGGGAATLDDLTDVDTTGAADNDVLTYDSGTSTWTPEPAGGAGSIALDDLTDVDAPTPSDDNVLAYDSASGEWIATALTGIPGGATDVQTFTAGGTWTKPAAANAVHVICVGAGGGGGGGGQGAAGRAGGGGGGGGAWWQETFRASDLAGTVTVTVGTGGTGGGGNANGNDGGPSSFGSYAQAGGGGGGTAGGGNASGGGGGGYLSGAVGASSGQPQVAAGGGTGLGNQAARSQASNPGGSSEYGGAAGGGASGTTFVGQTGGSSTRAGSGGGGGGGVNATPTAVAAAAGGLAGAYTGGGGGTAGTSGASPTAGGAGGTVTGRLCGSGGGGGGSGLAVTGATGGAGGRGSGGGGGGGTNSATGGTGGQGGDGLVIVMSW